MADTKRTSKRVTDTGVDKHTDTPTKRGLTLAEDLGKRDPFDLLEQEVSINLLRTVDLISVDFTELFEQHGLSGPLYNSLRIIAGEQKVSPEGITVGKISQRMVCRQPDTTRLIDRLESLGFVKRVTSDTDARKRMITITAKGTTVLQALHRPVRELHRQHFKCLTPAALEKLNRLLDAVRNHLTK